MTRYANLSYRASVALYDRAAIDASLASLTRGIATSPVMDKARERGADERSIELWVEECHRILSSFVDAVEARHREAYGKDFIRQARLDEVVTVPATESLTGSLSHHGFVSRHLEIVLGVLSEKFPTKARERRGEEYERTLGRDVEETASLSYFLRRRLGYLKGGFRIKAPPLRNAAAAMEFIMADEKLKALRDLGAVTSARLDGERGRHHEPRKGSLYERPPSDDAPTMLPVAAFLARKAADLAGVIEKTIAIEFLQPEADPLVEDPTEIDFIRFLKTRLAERLRETPIP